MAAGRLCPPGGPAPAETSVSDGPHPTEAKQCGVCGAHLFGDWLGAAAPDGPRWCWLCGAISYPKPSAS
jgi:hypothetical protein